MLTRLWGLAFVALFSISSADAATVYWADWTSRTIGTPGSASGVISPPSGGISVSYSGEVWFPTQVAGGTNYWLPNAPYLSGTVSNEPPASDVIAIVGGNSIVNTLTFSTPVTDPILAILSLGQTTIPVTYQFNAPFTILSTGTGFFGGGVGSLTNPSGNNLLGREGHGAIQFSGTFSSISWTVPNGENWHGFTVGVLNQTAVPEPGTFAIFGMFLALGVGCWLVRRNRIGAFSVV